MNALVWTAILFAAALMTARRVHRRNNRELQLMLLCLQASLECSNVDPFPDTLWLPFRFFGSDHARGTENVVWNAEDGDGARAFDYWREERSDDSVPIVRRFTCALVALPFSCRQLAVQPHGQPGGLDGSIEGDRIELEWEAFNRRFDVRADDRRFAVAFVDQRMMRAMMALPAGVTVLVNEDRMVLVAPLLPAGEVLLLLEAARALGRHVPPVVASLFPPRVMKGPHEDRWTQGRWSTEPIGDDR